MSTENERHPSSLSETEKAAMMKAYPAAFDKDEGADEKTPDPAALPEEAAAAPAADAAPKEDAAAAAPAAEAEDGAAADDAPVSRKEFNGVLNELRETRKELKQARTEPAAPARDFDAELKSLDEKLDADQKSLLDRYDEGEIDATELAREQSRLMKEYQGSVRGITVDESKQVAAATIQKQQAEAAAQSVQQAWDSAIGTWKDQNTEFLANPIRRDAVAKLLEQYGADDSLSNEQVIEQVQAAAFDAFNWQGKAAAPTAPADPHARRNASDRAAAAHASAATPPSLDGGVGGRGKSQGVDLEQMKPGQFSRLPREEQEKLLGEGAL